MYQITKCEIVLGYNDAPRLPAKTVAYQNPSQLKKQVKKLPPPPPPDGVKELHTSDEEEHYEVVDPDLVLQRPGQ